MIQHRVVWLHPRACAGDGGLSTPGQFKPDIVHGWSHFRGGEAAQECKYEFTWPLGDVVTALAQAGLRIERLTEYPSAERWHFGDKLDQVRRLPEEYLLLARK